MKIVKRLFATFFLLVALGLALTTFVIRHYTKNLPNISKTTLRSDASSNMYASNGRLIWSSAVNKRKYVTYNQLPKKYVDLLVATEDHNFWHDKGISPKGIANAGISYIEAKLGHGTARGGSTIEQQLIKLSVFSTSAKDRTIKRKVKEMFLAQQLDHNYSKKKILELYVNKIFLGEGSYGVQTIAQTYYGKPVKDLNISQLAILAGLGQAGSYYNLYDRPEAVKIRRNQVLKAGLTYHAITHSQYKKAINTSVTQGLKKRYWEGKRLEPISKAHASFINSTLNELTNKGYDLTKTPLQIHTSLDMKMDNVVTNIFDKHPEFFQNKRQQAAITITDPRTGYVLSQNGGRFTHNVTGLNRATSATRSTGSAIKPIVDYGPAFEYLGWSTNTPLDSNPYHYAGTNVTATNVGGASYGMVSLRRAVVESMNTPAIRTLDAVGPTKAKIFAGKLGISQKEPLRGSYAIGVDASTEQMAGAYGAFANGGIYYKPEYVKWLKFADQSIKKVKPESHRAMSKATAYVMTNVLRGVMTNPRGTLHAGQVKGVIMAAKTGTVAYPNNAKVPDDSAMDFWTCGYTKGLSISLWEGYDTPMKKNSFLWDMRSITLRGRLWRNLLTRIAKGKKINNTSWSKPKGVSTNYDGGLYVAHKAKIKKLHNIVPTKPNHAQKQILNGNSVKKNKQKAYDRPKKYQIGGWQKKYDKYRDKAQKQDDKKYGKNDDFDYSLDDNY